jgi:N-acetylglucosaminyldiphosphoundecaprenol N-acetyl-beta-D-mannosaminyltransferase
MKSLLTKSFLGIKIVDVDYDTFINFITKIKNKSKAINIMSINLTALKRYNDQFEYFINSFDFTTSDGKGLVLISGIIGDKIKNHLSIPRVCDKLIYKFYKEKRKIFLLGATEEVNNEAILNLKNKYPSILINGHHGYFDVQNMNKISSKIIEYKPELILVGISSPMKEEVILELSSNYTNSINIACGGYLDILSGKVGKAPEIIHKTGMEWLYRFYEEPKRMLGPMLLNGLFFLFYILPRAFLNKNASILQIMNKYNN